MMLARLKRLIAHLIKTALTVSVAIFTSFASVGIAFLMLVGIGAGIAAAGAEQRVPDALEGYEYFAGKEHSGNKIVSIGITGVILGSPDELNPLYALLSDASVVYGYQVKDRLQKLADEDAVKGVVLEINSPGGTIYGSQAIADGIAAYRKKTGKPIFAYVASMAASGGYWVAAAGDKILADHGTAVGSIGVITGPFKYYKDVVGESSSFGDSVETAGGITSEYITAGTHKDLGNPYRELTTEERASLQDSVNGTYAQFVAFVAQRRGIPESVIREQLGALIYSELQGKSNRLVDEVATRDEAYRQVAVSAGIRDDDFQVVKRQTDGGFFAALAGALNTGALQLQANRLATLQHAPRYSFCGVRSMTLVYEGDIAGLCQ